MSDSTNRTLIWIGPFPEKQIDKISDLLACKNNFFLVDDKKNGYLRSTNCQCVDLSEITKSEAGILSADQIPIYERAMKSIMEDPRSFYIMERLFRQFKSRSVFNMTVLVETIVINSLQLLESLRVSRFISLSTPHSAIWFFAKVAEVLGIDIYISCGCSIKNRSWVVKDMDRQEVVEVRHAELKEKADHDEVVSEFIDAKLGAYSEAIPLYEKEREIRYRGKFTGITAELRNIIASRSPGQAIKRIRSALVKQLPLKQYTQIANQGAAANCLPDKYVVFFLHFQPERTSLPEAGKFVQQIMVARLLSAYLPQGWKILVKEHPSMFRNEFSTMVRDSRFYRSLSNIKELSFVPLGMNSFELIDRSTAVVTLTGTVGVEALVRGKPVLAFGAAQFRGFKGVFPITSGQDVAAAFRSLHEGHGFTQEELKSYLKWVAENSFVNDANRFSSAALRYAVHSDS